MHYCHVFDVTTAATGTNCETEINDCVTPAYPCFGPGTDTSLFDNGCRDTLEGFECACRPGFTGMDCRVRRIKMPQLIVLQSTFKIIILPGLVRLCHLELVERIHIHV